MEAVYQEIRGWILKQPDWLQEATDRLLKNGRLADVDITQLAALIKTQEGQSVAAGRAFDALVKPDPAALDLRILSIGNVVGIENLAPRQPLAMGAGNLTVVYGHNGSGKSSYTRVLKCIARKPRASLLKSNVFAVAPAEQSCRVSIEVGGQPKMFHWNVNGGAAEELRAIDIFDSDEATHYLSSENPASYTPSIVSLFELLAKACDDIKRRLQTEQAGLVSALPVLPSQFSQTQPGLSYQALKASTSKAVLSAMSAWTDEDHRKLAEVSERLKVTDHSALAKQKRAKRREAQQIQTSLTQAAASFSLENIEKIRSLRIVATEKRRIAEEAGRVTEAKLEGVGTKTWHAMWEAARLYSPTAYPDDKFPVTDDARCLLCHQQLSPEAKVRLNAFEAFVVGALETDAKSAESVHTQALKVLPVAVTPEQIATKCQAAGLPDDCEQRLCELWISASAVRQGLFAYEGDGLVAPIDDIDEMTQALEKYSQRLEAEAVEHDRDALAFDRVASSAEKLSLEAKQWVAQQSEAVAIEVSRLKKVKDFSSWQSLANSRLVSAKASEISGKVITEAYVARFNDELLRLGANRLRVELVKTRAEKGKVLHRLQLKDAKIKQPIELVLSEGERRIVSLAAFLADVAQKPTPAPFIFDDPISSLDHDFEWNVATRLADLAKDRQVIVFTHRLSLYGAMEDVAKKIGEEWKKKHLQQMGIETYSGASGQPIDQATWNSRTDAANNLLLARLADAKRAGDKGGGPAYRGLAQGICSDYRKLLERTVEDDLLNDVIRRHRRSITTDNKLSAIHLLTEQDCAFIDKMMTKYSCYEHSQSREVPVFIPEEAELRADLESLKGWRAELKERRKAAARAA